MTTEGTTFSEHIRGVKATHNTFTRAEFLKRLRRIIEYSDWDERILSYEKWLNRGCIGVIIVSALYFFPVVIKVLLK